MFCDKARIYECVDTVIRSSRASALIGFEVCRNVGCRQPALLSPSAQAATSQSQLSMVSGASH